MEVIIAKVINIKKEKNFSFDYISSTAIILSLVLFFFVSMITKPLKVEANQWIEVTTTEEGQQWWDLDSLNNTTDGNIELLTRFSPNPNKNKESIITTVYLMEIDCSNRLFRDTQINGVQQFNKKWNSTDSDELINGVINQSCSYKTS